MTGEVSDVVVNVTADMDPLVKEFGRAGTAGEKLRRVTDRTGAGLKKFGAGAKKIGKSMSIMSGAIAGAAAASLALAKNTADTGNEIAKSARGVGVATDYYQEMEFAIGQVSDLSKGEFSNAMQRLSRTIGEGAKGTKAASAALEQLGFTQSQIASGSITTQQAFDAYIKKMDGLKDPAIAAAISSDLLGRSGARLGAQLAGSGGAIDGLRDRAHELGIVLSKDALDASEGFIDQMDELKRSFDAVKLKIGGELLPVFANKLIPMMLDKVVPALLKVGDKIGEMIGWFDGLPGPVQEAIGVIAAGFAVGGPILVGIGLVSAALGTLVAAAGPVGLFIAAAAILAAAWFKWSDDIKAAIGGAVDWITEKFNGFLAFVKAIPDQLLQIGRDMIQGLINGITEKWEELKSKIHEMADALPMWMRDLLGIESPSRVFMEIGGYIGEGLAKGIADSHAMVNQAVASLGGAAIAGSKNTANGVLANMQTMFQGSKKLSAGIALANSWLAFTEVLKDPSFVGRPWARIAAAGAALAAGLNAVANIKSASVGGGGGGSAAATQVATASAPVERRVAEFRFTGGNVLDPSAIVDAINEAYDQGYQIRGVLA